MQWPGILERVRTLCTESPEIVSVFGDAHRLTGTGDHVVPMLEYSLVTDSSEEQFAPLTIQFDIWADSLEDVIRVERFLRCTFDRSGQIDFGGLAVLGSYLDGEILASEDRDGYVGRAIRFRLTPLAERYVGAVVGTG